VVPRTLRMVLLCAALVAGCSDAPEVEDPAASGAYPEQETESYHTRQTRAGIAVWELWGDRAESYPGEEMMLLHGVRMHFYEEGERTAVLTAREAEVDQATEYTTARGEVVVVNAEGDQLESEVLHWDPATQEINTEEFVRFTRGDQLFTGYGMTTDPDLTNVQIHRQFEGDLPANQTSNEGEGR